MTRDESDRGGSGVPEHDPDDALKKPLATPKGGPQGKKGQREARLVKALRDNLRRRKAAGREAGRTEKETD